MIMRHKLIFSYIIAGIVVGSASCTQDKIHIESPGNFADTSGTLKDASATAGFPVGMAINQNDFTGNSAYAALVKANCGQVTFENIMKEGYIQQNDGSLDFTNADHLVSAVTGAGLQVYGHNLVWYSQQNATYLDAIAGTSANSGPANLLTNGSFESWNGSTPAGWAFYNQQNGAFSQGSGAGNAQDGSYSLAITVSASSGSQGSGWKSQVASPSFNTVSGDTYLVTFWAKGSSAGGYPAGCVYQLEGRSGSFTGYSGDQALTTGWASYSYSFTAQAATSMITFDMGDSPAGSTTYIDKVTIIDETAAQEQASPAAIAERLDSVMHLYITGVVGHYAGKVVAWDVVNEPMSDGSSGIRTSSNTNVPAGATGYFFWSDYMGRDYAANAFKYAHAADPKALLFINDYGLESNTAKLDSLIAYVKELKALGAPIDGIGTEMHISWNTSQAGIDNMFQQLAATGLKIRISELDVSVNPFSKPDIGATSLNLLFAYQAAEYKYVVQSFIKNVPQEQRYGMTVWGVDDPGSWLYKNGNDFPLLFNGDFSKKAAFSAVLQGLKEQ